MKNFLGQEGITIFPQAAMGSECWRSGQASRARDVEKPADEEPTGHRFLQWVVRHANWLRSGDVQPVDLTGVKHIRIVRFLYACERLTGPLRPPGRTALGESRAQGPGRSWGWRQWCVLV